MKYKLENIPVWRAYEADADCALCFLETEVEPQYVRFFLGNSVMVPEMRVEVNRDGFCGRHLELLLAGDNKLGLSLLLETHLEQLERFLTPLLEAAPRKRIGPRDRFGTRKRIGPRASHRESGSNFDNLTARLDRCLLCDRLANTLDNFAYTIVMLYARDDAFREKFRSSQGFCLRHLARVLRIAGAEAPARSVGEWSDDLRTLEKRWIASLRAGLQSFAENFDYRNRNEMTPDAKVSLPNAVTFLGGRRRQL